MRFLFGLSALVLPMVMGFPLAQRASDPLPSPGNDTFYKAPADLSSYQEGQVIRSRQVDVSVSSSDLDSAFQLLYSTHNTQMDDQATVATAFIPKKPVSPPKVLSIQIFEDAVSFDCSPSWSFTAGTKSSGAVATGIDAPQYISWALGQGYYVVAADHEGPESAFIAGYAAGMRVLDGVRAINNFKKLSSPQVAFVGYSGGAHATVWATQMAETYAKELNIVGAAHGGTPLDVRNVFNFINGGFFGGFAGAGVIGLTNDYPDLYKFVHDNLKPEGEKALAKAQGPNFCLASVAIGFPFVDFTKFITVPDPLNAPIPKRIFGLETLLTNSSSNPSAIAVPKYPRYIYHSLEDEVIPLADAKTYVKEQCAQGADINFATFPVSEHATGLLFGIVPSISFLKNAFEGTVPKVQCGSSTAMPTLNSPEAKSLIGTANVQKLLSLDNTKSPFGPRFNLNA